MSAAQQLGVALKQLVVVFDWLVAVSVGGTWPFALPFGEKFELESGSRFPSVFLAFLLSASNPVDTLG